MKLDIVYASDDNYAYLAGISIFSLFESNRDAEAITIHYFEDGISEENRTKLKETAADFGRTIVFYDVRERLKKIAETVPGLPIFMASGKVRKSYATYGRIFIGELLPADLKSVLYIDCDTFVDGPLTPLFSEGLNGAAVLMTIDPSRPEYKIYVGHQRTDYYFNAGVILFDLTAWRERGLQDKLIDCILHDTHPHPFSDQDYLNHALKGQTGILPIRYNFISAFFLYSHAGTKYVYGFDDTNRFYSKAEFDAAQKHPVIYHFCGLSFTRPYYKNSIHPVKKRYDRAYYASRWRDVPQAFFKNRPVEKCRQFLTRFTPRWFAAFVGQIAMKRAMRMWR